VPVALACPLLIPAEDVALRAIGGERFVAVRQVVGIEHDALLVDLGVAHGRGPGGHLGAAVRSRSPVNSSSTVAQSKTPPIVASAVDFVRIRSRRCNRV